MAKDLFDVFGSYNQTVIPLFILMGQTAFHSGIISRLFKVAYTVIRHWPGGMAAVTLPEMRRYHYHDSLAPGVADAGGSIGILIPPVPFSPSMAA